MKKRSTRKKRSARKTPKVGDRVSIRFGDGSTPARVVEDVGPFGPDGHRIFRVQLLEVDREFDVLAEDIVAPA